MPLITGQVINQTYTINTINQNGTAYIDNKEYNTLKGNPALTTLQRVYNAEGYAQNITATTPNYYYYRQDHLGNNREVWLANTKKTVQSTQYYPCGLPWASIASDSVGLQERKYNGKEFVEMHGYDTYDYGARGYYAAIGRFQTVDPLAEKYYSISPYAYCAGNPVRYVDIQGKYLVDSKGYVMYNNGGWTKYATVEAKRIGNSMMATSAGNNQFNKFVNATHPITLSISLESKTTTTTNLDGSITKKYKLGNTSNTVDKPTGKVTKSAITIYEGSINDLMKESKNSTNPLNQSFQNNTTNNDQRIGAVAGHEAEHATDPVNQQQSHDNEVNGTKNDLEVSPTKIEMQILDQQGLENMTPLPNPLLNPLPAPEAKPLK